MVASLEFEAFRQWLLAAPDVPVGKPGCDDTCPLACYLSAVMGEVYEVSGVEYVAMGSGERAMLPWWAVCFVHDVDTGYSWESWVMGQQALAVLDEIEG